MSYKKNIINLCKLKKITSFSDLMDYCLENEYVYFRYLCDDFYFSINYFNKLKGFN